MFAGVAELADAQASGACGSNVVWVQVPSPAFFAGNILTGLSLFDIIYKSLITSDLI